MVQIKIFSCGGTIDKVYFDANSEFMVGEPQIDTVFREAGVTFQYQIESLLRKDSLEMTEEDRGLVRQRVAAEPWTRILITHGTDTMTATAAALEGIPDKTIVLTGSMTPVRFRVSDAVFNIGLAVGALLCKPAGVYVAMNGQVFPAGHVRKNLELKRFEWA
ncbi:MAG TPA: asparaginase domain-containing protein [Pirellulaceae bacterium]